ncbi:MAG: HesA/MoeB/ThiF family protein [Thermoleophilia bacterium]
MTSSVTEEDIFYREMVDRNIGVYTWEEQERLRRSRVAICGLGGVGGYEAILCARMGIGSVTGVDFDSFEVSNINRQMLATMDTIDRPKADAMEEALKSINPGMEVNSHQTQVDEDNVADLLSGHDVVLEAVDDMPTRVIIHRTARELGIPSVGMSGSPPTRGFVATFLPDGVRYEDALNLPEPGKKLTDMELRQRIADIKKKRAWHSVKLGAPAEWAQAYCDSKASWIITPVRAHLLSLFSFHEVVQLLAGREPLAVAPKGILIDLSQQTPVVVSGAPPGGWDYATL